MNRVCKILFFAGALIILAAASWAWSFFGPRGFTNQKAIWSAMQGVEAEYRDKEIATPFLLTVSAAGYPLHLVAFRTSSETLPYMWVELSLEWKIEESSDHFFRMGGNVKPLVACAAVQKLITQEKVTQAAQRFLNENCQP